MKVKLVTEFWVIFSKKQMKNNEKIQNNKAKNAQIIFVISTISFQSGPVHHLDTPYESATFGMGCFWGAESLFGGTYGVLRTKVGYSGGSAVRPQYRNLYVIISMMIDIRPLIG